jgi:glycosyltransferase involved in cell wall biosynthesis
MVKTLFEKVLRTGKLKNMARKKRILFHSDFALAKTGFGRASKAVLSYLYKTNKYELHHLCCGHPDDSKILSATPWKSYGSITREIAIKNRKDDAQARRDSYGESRLDELIKEIKPDVYIGTQDFWGLDFSIEKTWFNKVSSAIWTTLDSLPILKSAKEQASKIKNYWVWSNFAEKALHKEGFSHVKTLHGPIDTDKFSRLSADERATLRKKNGIPENAFIIGFVFRNQLRKLVPNLMEGYKLWKDSHPEIRNTYLLLHTNLAEGWNIPEQAKIHGIDNSEILVTYICKNCRSYEVKSYDDRGEEIYLKDKSGKVQTGSDGKLIEKKINLQEKDCKYCQSKKTQQTCGTSLGVTEDELNEIYNLMDVYVHPFTSGGQEIPIQEAKLTELVTLVTNYSCGEECCAPEAGSLPLNWAKYLEHGTEFIKASTYPESIKEQLDVFLNMDDSARKEMGLKARRWVLENYSVKSVCSKIESFIDLSPLLDEEDLLNYVSKSEKQDPNAKIPNIESDPEWVIELYRKILGRDIDKSDSGFAYWISLMSNGTPRHEVENYFRKTAQSEIAKNESSKASKNKIEELLIKNNKKRILFCIPGTIGDCFLCTSIFGSMREIYPETEWDIYVASNPEYESVFYGNKKITKWIPFQNEMENCLHMEGAGDHPGYFDIAFYPYFGSQRTLDYTHNGLDKLLL